MTSIKEDILQAMILAVISIILGFGFVLLLIELASASSSCMTHKEARAKYPRAHLYWNTEDRCWDRRRWSYEKKKRHKQYAMATPAVQTEKPKPKSEQDYCCWPKLPRDEAGNIIEPPPTFAEKWEQMRDVFRSVWKRLTE